MLTALVRWVGRDKPEWHVVERYRRVTLLSGLTSSSHYLWGRKVHGRWQYREMSADEYNTHLSEVSL